MPITPEEITWSYRLILGREPSARDLETWRNVPSLAEMRRLCLASAEFRANQPTAPVPASPPRLSIHLPRQAVEWQTDTATQARLVDHVMRTWTALGQEKPHWSVLSSENFLPGRIEETKASFYASGVRDWDHIATSLARHGRTPAEFARVLEYGCGVGRVTPHLAKHFAHVTGIDISAAHLDMARQAASDAGNANTDFMLARAPDFGMTTPFDLWFSYIVLQHNPPPVMAMILRRALTLLAPRGIAIFQLPVYAMNYRFEVARYLNNPTKTGTIEMHCLPQRVVFEIAAACGCTALEMREDGAAGPPSHWLSNIFIITKP